MAMSIMELEPVIAGGSVETEAGPKKILLAGTSQFSGHGEDVLFNPPSYSTSGPGCGYTGSVLSGIKQELMPDNCATKISGN